MKCFHFLLLFETNFLAPLYHASSSSLSSRHKSIQKAVLKNFAKFTGRHLCRSLFWKNCWAESLQRYQKETPAQLFSSEFCEILKTTNFEEHLRPAATVDSFTTCLYSVLVLCLYNTVCIVCIILMMRLLVKTKINPVYLDNYK